MIDVPEGETPGEPSEAVYPPAARPLSSASVPVEPRASGLPKWLIGACVLLLLVAGYLFMSGRNGAADDAAQIEALNQRGAALETRLKALESRPAPVQPDLRPLQQGSAELSQKLATLEQKLAAVDQHLTALEQKPPAPASLDAPARAELAALAGRIDQLVQRSNQLGETAQADVAHVQEQIAQQDQKVQGQLAQQDQRLGAAVKNSAQLDQLTARAAALTTVQGAMTALAAGRPLGELAGAPPALAQFATKAPPTEAALRLSYADAADAARTAGLPPRTDGAFLDRIWARAQSSVTVRQGDRVLVGDPISGVLSHAQLQVEAGDLAGALHTLDQLAGPAAAAMAQWRQQAQSLLDARAALSTMAHG